MLSLNTRFATISPAQYQRINQAGLLILISSAALAPAWLNIITVAGYSIMNWLTFKRLVISIIESVLGQRQPAAHSAPVRKLDAWHASGEYQELQRKWQAHPKLISRTKPSLPINRSYRMGGPPKGGIKYE
jgi:hypothetical protein